MYIDVNEDNFEKEVTESFIPVLADFWAPWCKVCELMKPEIERAADELGSKVKLCKINCDESEDLALSCGVRGIPAVYLYKGKEKLAEFEGLIDADEIIKTVNSKIK